jgi:type II secretory pathway component PulK
MNQKGSALLAVLWMTVILSFIGATLASTVRSEVASTQMLVRGEQGYFLARAGIEASLLQMLRPSLEDFRGVYNFQFETGSVIVEYRPASALYNVNVAPVPMLAALFDQLGLSSVEADALARQIELYRHPPDPIPSRAIVSLEELLSLPLMTSNLFYGGFREGKVRPALFEVLGAFGSGDTVNVNYARPELLAVMPGMNPTLATDIIAARPIRKLEPVAEAWHLSLSDSQAFTLIAHGRAKDADFDRIIRADYVRDQKRPLNVRLIAWHDTN